MDKRYIFVFLAVCLLFGTASALGNPPVAAFTTNVTTGNAPLSVQFNDTSSNGVPTSWNWSFGDGTYSSDQNASHQFTYSGNFTVLFTSTNADGSTNKTSYINATFDRSSYGYVMKHMVNGSSTGTLTGYQISLLLFNTSGSSTGESCYLGSGYTRPDWGDVRFSQDNVTDLPYWIETSNMSSTSAKFWINMSSIASGTTTQTPLYVLH
jgi:PKD repeat protein